jgi:hypothetical protein
MSSLIALFRLWQWKANYETKRKKQQMKPLTHFKRIRILPLIVLAFVIGRAPAGHATDLSATPVIAFATPSGTSNWRAPWPAFTSGTPVCRARTSGARSAATSPNTTSSRSDDGHHFKTNTEIQTCQQQSLPNKI